LNVAIRRRAVFHESEWLEITMKLFAFLLLSCLSRAAVASSGTIAGTVAGISGAPVSNGSVDVTINGVGYGNWPLDAQGTFNQIVTWAGAGSASCTVHTNAPDYVDQSSMQSLAASGTVNFVFSLTPADVLFADGFEL
jgi:hypothetical protein